MTIPEQIPAPVQQVQVVTPATPTTPQTIQTLPPDDSLTKFIAKKYPWIGMIAPVIKNTLSAAMRRVELAITAGIITGITLCYTNYENKLTSKQIQHNASLTSDLQIAVDGYAHTNSLSDIQTNSKPTVITITNTVVTYKTNN